MLALVIFLIAIALVFDFINGFHDAANSIATVVSTRVLTPGRAVLWAAFFNFVAAFGFGLQVAKTMGKGLIHIDAVTPQVILAGLLGAIVWDLITWYFGMPTSSSHALIGGYAGAAAAWAGFGAIIWSGWTRTVAFIVIAPLLGMLLGLLLMLAINWICRRQTPRRVDVLFRRLQLFSAAVYSLGHGTNDAQKTMGIIAGVLYTSGFSKEFSIPFWVVLACHAAIGLGTLSGGWRIVRTMGMRITQLRPVDGFAAESAGAITLLGTAALGIPVSTTHTITGAIMGVGSLKRFSAVRWGVATRIVWVWILTIPASALIAALVLAGVRLLS
ncbi:MAG: inorganic phosphate transporter [Candidatus Krumholzibacteriia bacterium]